MKTDLISRVRRAVVPVATPCRVGVAPKINIMMSLMMMMMMLMKANWPMKRLPSSPFAVVQTLLAVAGHPVLRRAVVPVWKEFQSAIVIIIINIITTIIIIIAIINIIISIPTNVPFLLLVLWHHVKGKPRCLHASMQASPYVVSP